MEQVLTERRRSSWRTTGKIINVVLWVLQIAGAGMLLMVGFLKLSGNAQLVGLFQAVGLGQWFRYLTGTLEVAGAILLLIPRMGGLAALMLAVVMVGAVITHVFIVGGSPQPAIILLIVTGIIAWGRRQRTSSLFSTQMLTSFESFILDRVFLRNRTGGMYD